MNNLLEIKKLTYTIGSGSIEVTSNLNISSALQVIGPSGSGKTTLLRTIAHLNESVNGEVVLSGHSWSEYSSSIWRRNVHYLAQKPVLFDGTVRQNLTRPFELTILQREIKFDEKQAMDLAEEMQLPGKIMDQDARTLSGGEAARVGLIRAMLINPKVLLLDEPLASLDSKTANDVIKVIGEWYEGKKDRGIIIVSHTGELKELPALKAVNLLELEGEKVE